MAALIPDEKWLVLLQNKKIRLGKTQQTIIWDKCCHLRLMEPQTFGGLRLQRFPF